MIRILKLFVSFTLESKKNQEWVKTSPDLIPINLFKKKYRYLVPNKYHKKVKASTVLTPTLLFVFFLFLEPQPRLRYPVSHILCRSLRRYICEDKTSFLNSSNCLLRPKIKHYEIIFHIWSLKIQFIFF